MLTIGKLATLARLTSDSLRFYEREGLIAPNAKTRAGYRLYEETALRRLRFIHHAKECGFTLTEIRELLALQRTRNACCNDIRARAVEKRLQLEYRIKSMRAMSDALDRLIADCHDGSSPSSECRILSGLERSKGSDE